MLLSIITKNYYLTVETNELLSKKIMRLTRYCERLKDESSTITVRIEGRDTKKRSDSVKVEVQIALPHKVLRAESRKNNVLDGLDSCLEKLEEQTKEYKERRKRGGIHKMRRVKVD